MSASMPLVPVFATKFANAYPKPENTVCVDLVPLGEALTRQHRTDAHFAAYTSDVARRLNNDAVGHVRITMAYLVADVDDPVAHRLRIDARDEWRIVEEQKIAKLRERHPNAVVYGTNGGVRLVFSCDAFPIAKAEDTRAWWSVYGRFVRYLRAEFEIVADPTCKDFGRLYRLPQVRRDGVQLESPVAGDTTNIERLDVKKFPEERATNPFVAAALKDAVKKVRTAVDGQRNKVLNREAYALGGFVPGGYVDAAKLHDALLAAIVANGGDEEKDSEKIHAAIESGKTKPRSPPKGNLRLLHSASASHSGAQRAKRRPAAGAAAPGRRWSAPAEDERLGDGRPEVHITTEIMEMTNQASAALGGDPMVYQRNAQLVHVTATTCAEVERSDVVETDDGLRRGLVEGTPRIRIVQFATLKERLSAVAQFLKYDPRRKEKWVPARPDGDVVAALLARGEWKDVRALRGIVETPTLRADGSILQGEPRYDAATGLLYAPNANFPPVPDRPTARDAEAAYSMVVDLLSDFPHEDDERDKKGHVVKAGSHKAVPIAHALTIIGRPAITNSGIPMFVYDANTRAAGKTLQSDIAAIIATGRPMPRMTYPPSDEELEKRLAGYALRGALLLCMDNVLRPLGGGALDAILTARDTVELRVLSTLEIPTLIWLAVVSATGNNVGFRGDTGRRSLVSRLESLEVRPEARTDFKRPDLLDYVMRRRPEIVVALLTILRAYFVADRPEMGCERWGSFEGWSGLIPPAIVHAGGVDPMQARAKTDATPEDESFAAFLDGMFDHLDEGEVFTAASVREWLYPSDGTRPTDDTARDARESVELLCGRVPASGITNALGLKLRQYKEKVFEVGKRRLRVIKASERAGSARWAIEEVGHA